MNYGNGELPNGGWISVSEKLPEVGQSVLISSKDFGIIVGMYVEVYKEDVRNNEFLIHKSVYSDAMISIDVTAWMPLPEPYKEK